MIARVVISARVHRLTHDCARMGRAARTLYALNKFAAGLLIRADFGRQHNLEVRMEGALTTTIGLLARGFHG